LRQPGNIRLAQGRCHNISRVTQVLEWQVQIRGETTSAVFEPATAADAPVFVCAHGAGGHMSDAGMLALAKQFRHRGLHVVRFNFLYRQRQTRAPDPQPLLKQTIGAVVDRVRSEVHPTALIIGGRSMGGRAASHLAGEGFVANGLVLLAYPLHPAGRPQELRDLHLGQIGMPVLCFNGTRDALCGRDLMEGVLRHLKGNWTMHWLEGADHGFHVLKSSGRTDGDVLNEIGEATVAWWDGVRPSARAR
jgi:predicted alpha/beta-hydrolase family hydrolase